MYRHDLFNLQQAVEELSSFDMTYLIYNKRWKSCTSL